MKPQVANALAAWSRGGLVIALVETSGGERGDLMVAADFAGPARLNELLLHARGILSLAVSGQIYQQLELSLDRPGRLSPNPRAPRAATTVDATAGIGTGISAADRARTIAAVIDPRARPHDLRQPGHVPVLLAAAGGVSERPSPVEAAVEMSNSCGLRPAGVVSEVLGHDGELAGGLELEQLARKLRAPLISITELGTHCRSKAA